MTQNIHLINADVITGLKSIDNDSVDTIITSPPYWNLRDYQVDGQIGMEPTLKEYHNRLLDITTQLKRVLKPTGVLFWNHGDSYGGNQGRGPGKGNEYNQMVPQKDNTTKCLTMQNERLIIKMIDDQGWILRNRIIWHKPNGMPSSVTDRFTNKYESVYMLTKNTKYHFDLEAVKIPAKYQEVWSRKGSGKGTPYETTGNNPRSRWGLTKDEIKSGVKPDGFGMKNPGDVWTIPTQPHKDAHFAIFPDDLVEPMIKAGCPLKVCPKCGFIQERITKRENINPRKINGVVNNNEVYSRDDGIPKTGSRCGDTLYHTTGYTSCDCNADYEPGTVLDPFAGSGTTMKVAKSLGCSAIGIELNPEYCKIIKKNLLFHQNTLGNIINKFTVLE